MIIGLLVVSSIVFNFAGSGFTQVHVPFTNIARNVLNYLNKDYEMRKNVIHDKMLGLKLFM